jgi:putative cardiolipin synthase
MNIPQLVVLVVLFLGAWRRAAWRVALLAVCYFEFARMVFGAIVVAISLLGVGCASLPAEVPRTESQARTDIDDSTLARVAAASLEGHGMSGLRLMPAGDQAFDARIALARSAEKSIDAQYFILAHDTSGRQFLRELRDAALRGVRVRLLIDDLYAGDDDGLLGELAAHAGFELRVFNPLPVRTGTTRSRVLLSLHELGRVQRRMHNKLFVADNSFAVTGGRNVADEYFGRSEPANFIDMDALVAGPAVRELSASFDAYWNSPRAYPFDAIADQGTDPALARASFDARVRDLARFALPAGALDSLGRGGVGEQIAQGRVALSPAAIRVVADPVERDAAPAAADALGNVMDANLALLRSARSEVLIVSPYFVPMDCMIAALDDAGRGGARVTVMTNSLATTDVPLVHFGYARHRPAILRMGISLYELIPAHEATLAQSEAGRGSLGRLHAKLAVVDRRWVYIGSMNMDPRSARLNTELGLIVDSRALADELAGLLHREQVPTSFSVSQAPEGGGLRWSFQRGGQPQVLAEEPSSTWVQRLYGSLLSLVVSEDSL